MSDYVTKTELKAALREQTDEIMSVVQMFMHQVDERFTRLENDNIDIKRSLDRLSNTIDGFVKRLDEESLENKMRDRQFERLLEWARKVSEKTGIPLENL